MTATPDSFSMDELKSLLENAPADITEIAAREPEANGPYGGFTKEQVIKIAEDTVAELHELCRYHEALFWSRDAGKFQAIMCILDTIGVCDDDFTVNT